MINVLMVSKACLVGAYQTKLEAIAQHDDIALTVLVPPTWNDPAGQVTLERSHTNGYELIVDRLRFNGRYHLYYFPTLAHRLATLQPDILHIDEEPYNLATWLALRQARRRGVKTLFFSWQNLARRYPPPFRQMERYVLRHVDYGLAGNAEASAVWRAKGYAGPLKIVPQFGVSEALFRPNPRPSDGRFLIGMAGRRLVPEKGADVLLRAAARLNGNWRLLIAGEGPLRQNLVELADALGVANRVDFVGTLSSAQIPAFLQQLDALVLPSRTTPSWKEQFGRVLTEAMACAVPVIGSDSGEIPNVIGTAGLVFPEDDIDSLAEQLKKLLDDPPFRARLGQLGRERVLAHYTQSQIAAQTVAVYREMMAQAQP